MRESKTEHFEGLAVTVQQLPAMRAVKLSRRLAALLAPLAPALAADGDVSVLGEALGKALEAFSEKDLEALIKEVLEGATVEEDGKISPLLPRFEDIFAGRVLLVYRVLIFALEVNFADFFEKARGALRTGALSVSKSPASTQIPGSAIG